jgi:hypothetical protein
MESFFILSSKHKYLSHELFVKICKVFEYECLEKLIITELVNIFSVLYRSLKFITEFM